MEEYLSMGSTPVPEKQRHKQNALLSMWLSGLIIKTAVCTLLLNPKYRECSDSIFTSLACARQDEIVLAIIRHVGSEKQYDSEAGITTPRAKSPSQGVSWLHLSPRVTGRG